MYSFSLNVTISCILYQDGSFSALKQNGLTFFITKTKVWEGEREQRIPERRTYDWTKFKM